MNREIELKFRVSNERDFITVLSKKGILLSSPITQVDTIFFRKGKGFPDLLNGEPVLRIRQNSGVTTTTLKKYVKGIYDRKEIECQVSDGIAFQEYLELLDIFPVVVVSKTRRNANYKETTITLDNVRDLGVFTEIEIVSDDNNVEQSMYKINKIAEELNLNLKNIVKTPYDEMLFQKRRYKI